MPTTTSLPATFTVATIPNYTTDQLTIAWSILTERVAHWASTCTTPEPVARGHRRALAMLARVEAEAARRGQVIAGRHLWHAVHVHTTDELAAAPDECTTCHELVCPDTGVTVDYHEAGPVSYSHRDGSTCFLHQAPA